MKLHGVDKLPNKAGVARLHYWKNATVPERNGGDILIPLLGDYTSFYSLQGGEQFVWSWGSFGGERRGMYFGGTDEAPFLVQLLPDQLLATLESADRNKEFYAALKPLEVSAYEKVLKKPAVRQGDWFAVPFPPDFDWKSVFSFSHLVFGGSPNVRWMETPAHGHSLEGTRHLLFGGRYSDFTLPIRPMNRSFLIGEGVLRAPDHADLVLDRPHALFQTNGLLDPQKAD